MVALYLDNGDDPETRLASFEGGPKIDSMIDANRLDSLYERCCRVLFDKDGLAARLPESTGAAPRRSQPTADEFTASVTEFWFEAGHMPTYLIRGVMLHKKN